MRNILVISLLLCFNSYYLSGQSAGEANPVSGVLALRIKSISFIEDNEYFNPIVEGYTLLGFFFQPELIYTPSEKVSLSGGAHILKYYGTENFSQIRPVFSTTLHFSKKTSLTLGTLSGPDKHLFLDPHFYSERLYNQYVEDGFQLTHVNDHIFTDTWISWENFIFKGDSAREQFTFGESFRYTSSPIADFMHLEVPVQLQLKHMGGQISDYPQQMESFINIAAGLRLNFDLAEKRLGQAGIEYLQFINKLREGDTIAGFSHGNASWIRLHYSYKKLRFATGYWNAHNFYAPNGNPIFGSLSVYQPDVVIPDRRIITNSLSFRFFPASSLELFFGVDVYYDIDLKRADQAYTLHLNFDKLINLLSTRHKANEHEHLE
jgi:hypothetical protein